jgi:hypothetical protein
MTRKISPKEEWIRYSGLDWSDEDRWLGDNIAALLDVKEPDEQQRRLLQMADLRLSLFDLPAGAKTKHKEELLSLAQRQFGRTKRI